MTRCLLVLVLGLAFTLHPSPFTGVAWADVPRRIHYQGKLANADGSPLIGEHVLMLRLYGQASGGSLLWEEQHVVRLSEGDNGVFALVLGSQASFGSSISFNDPLWLVIAVDGSEEFSPRQALAASSYAINADTLDGLDSGQFLRADQDTTSSGRLMLSKSGVALLIKPVADPAADTELIDVQNAASASRFSVDLEGDVSVAGNLAVTGTISGSTSVTGTTNASWTVGSGTDATANNLSLLLGQTSGQESLVFQGASTDDFVLSDDLRLSGQSALRFLDSDSSHYVALRAPSTVGTEVTWTLPSADGSSGQVLSTDGSGTLSWATMDTSSTNEAPPSASYVTISADGTLSAERTLAAGVGLTLTDGGANAAATLAVDVGATAGKIVQVDTTGALPAVSGANLTSLNASNLTTGTVPEARLPSSVSSLGATIESAEVADGTLVSADTAGAFLAAGSGILVTKGDASWTVAATLGTSIEEGELGAGSVGASALAAGAIQPGDIEVADLPAHASAHQPGGIDALPTAEAISVGSANAAGTSTSLARADHLHAGLHSLAVSGQPQILGDTILAAGSSVALSQSGGTITIAAPPGNRVSSFASNAMTIGTTGDTDLLSVTITKSQAGSTLLLIATVQLNHTALPLVKTVEIKLFRDATQLDASYSARIGAVDQVLPVTLHAWETSGAGTYTFTLRAQSSGAGVQAAARRLTVIEIL